MPAGDDELLALAHDLYKRLGGIGNKDARIVRELLNRWQDRHPPLMWLPRGKDGAITVPSLGKYWIEGEEHPQYLEAGWRETHRIAGPIPAPREPEGG